MLMTAANKRKSWDHAYYSKKKFCLLDFEPDAPTTNATTVADATATANFTAAVATTADATTIATADSASAAAALTDGLSIIAEVVDTDAADATAAATAVATSDRAAAVTHRLSIIPDVTAAADLWSLNAGTVQTPAACQMVKSRQAKLSVHAILRAGSTRAWQVVARRKHGSHKCFCQRCMCCIVCPEVADGNMNTLSTKWVNRDGETNTVSPADEFVCLLSDPSRVNGIKSKGMQTKRDCNRLVLCND